MSLVLSPLDERVITLLWTEVQMLAERPGRILSESWLKPSGPPYQSVLWDIVLDTDVRLQKADARSLLRRRVHRWAEKQVCSGVSASSNEIRLLIMSDQGMAAPIVQIEVLTADSRHVIITGYPSTMSV